MSDMTDLGGMLEKFLSDPHAGEQLAGALQALGGMHFPEANTASTELDGKHTEPSSESTSAPLFPEGIDLAKIMQFKQSYDALKNGKDERIELLLALKPFLNDHRAKNVDGMVKMLRFSKLGNLLKDFDLKGMLF